MRRTVHLAVKHGTIIPALVALINSILTTLRGSDPRIWRRTLGRLLQLWTGVCDTSKEIEKEAEFDSKQSEIFSLSDTTPDVMFNEDFNLLVLTTDFTIVENLQKYFTTLIRTQAEYVREESMRDTIQRMCVNQLEIGEVDLKAETLKLLAILGVGGSLELWLEESHYLSEMLNLLTSGDLTNTEAATLEEAWVECVEALIPAMEEPHIKIMSQSLFPVWSSVSDMDQFKMRSLQFLSSITKLLNTCVRSEENPGMVRGLIMEKNSLDIQLLGSVASSELIQSEAWRTREDRTRLSLTLISQSWNTLTTQVEATLHFWENVKQFCSVLETLFYTITTEDPSVSMEMMNKSTLEELAKNLTQHLSDEPLRDDGVGVADVLECVESLVKVCHLWPGSSSLASPILGVQHLLAGVLSLAWLQDNDRTLDLNTTDLRDIISSKRKTWDMNSKNRAISLLCHLPKEVCPKWRMSVAKAAWAEKCPGLVSALPALITNTGLTSSLASDVISLVVGRAGDLEMVQRLASVSGDYVCSLARRTSSKLMTEAGLTRVSLVCQHFDGGRARETLRTPVKSSSVKSVRSGEVVAFLKLIGHQDKNVRMGLLSLLRPLALYSSMSKEAANLWMNYVSDEDEEVRHAFADNIGWMFKYVSFRHKVIHIYMQ